MLRSDDEKRSSNLTTADLAVTSTSIPTMGSAAFGGLETREPLTAAQIDGIARGLLAQLTLDEKIGMMHGDTSFFEGFWHLRRDGYFRQPRTTAGAIPRLGIPGVRFSDGPRGFHGEGATTFPQGSACRRSPSVRSGSPSSSRC